MNVKQLAKDQQDLQEELNKFSALRSQYKKMVESRGKLEVQLNENKIVKEELDLLEDDAKVFKLIGPALVKIELKESKTNVNTRMDYIQSEIKRQDKALEQIGEQQQKYRDAIIKLEQKIQKQVQA